MIGYKAFNKDLTCKGFQYEIGKTYEMEDKPVICERGFHFCKNIADTYEFYPKSANTRICKVESLGDIDKEEDKNKYCTNRIRILEEITETWERNGNSSSSSTGYCNSGDYNSGNRNSGDYNSGNWNSGDYNSGNWNSGDYNSGDCNSGYRNSGIRNSGDYNSGNRNSGDYNSGDYNSGDYNSGNWNSGNWNSGDWNSGDYNSGDCNSGYRNSGNRNSGDYNSGNWNSGDYNSGNWNSGDYNSGDYNSGVFNTSKNPTIKMFDKESNWTIENWVNSVARYILNKCPHTYSNFIPENHMTNDEKVHHPEYKTIGGYIKTIIATKEDKQSWWDNLSQGDRQECYNLPNFERTKFEECVGIKIKKEQITWKE